MADHEWCRCTREPCGVEPSLHFGHCCLMSLDCDPLGWMVDHNEHCHLDHSDRIAEIRQHGFTPPGVTPHTDLLCSICGGEKTILIETVGDHGRRYEFAPCPECGGPQ